MPKINPIISYHPVGDLLCSGNSLKKKAIRLFPRLPLKSYRRDFSLMNDLFKSTKIPFAQQKYYNLSKRSLYLFKPIMKYIQNLSSPHLSYPKMRLLRMFNQNLTNLKVYETTIQDKSQLKPIRCLGGLKSLKISTKALTKEDKEICMKLGKYVQEISSLRNAKISLTKVHLAELLCFLKYFPSGVNLSLSLEEIEGDPWLPSLDTSSLYRIKSLKLDKYPISLLEFLLRKTEFFEGLNQLDLLSVNWGLALNKHKDLSIFSQFRSFENLKSLKVNFQLSYPNSESAEKFLENFQIAQRSLKNLHLELNNFAPTDKDPEAKKFYRFLSQIQKCSKLTNLYLKFEFCQLKNKELNDLALHLPHNLEELRVLTLKIECFEVILETSGLCNWLKSLENLEYLELILPGISPSKTPIESLKLPQLKKLHIQLTPSYSPTEEVIKSLFDFLRNIKTITWLTLDFSAIEISSKTIEFIVKQLVKLNSLKQLKITLSGEYGQLDTLLRFQTLFSECPALRYLDLDTKIFVPWEAIHKKEEKFKEHFRVEKSKFGKALAIQVKNGTLV